MTEQETVLVLDAGNTSIKIGVFQNAELTDVYRFNNSEFSKILSIKNKFNHPPCILSSVLSLKETNELAKSLGNCNVIDHNTPVPIKYAYITPQTLGIDRICNAVAVAFFSPRTKAVCIDIGTCVKFDFVDEHGIYQGGSISPGIQLRYKSLNDYTANLPLVKDTIQTPLIGKSTIESIRSGVLNGIESEINHLIQRYSTELGDLTFFMTGGDAKFFDIPRKNNIFVDENLTLKGLYQIYLFNAH